MFPAGPPAAIVLYTVAPNLLIGWPRANRADEREFLLPDIGARPEVGRITGRGNTANLEEVLALKPDLILDIGSVNATYISLADRVQQQTGIPYALLDGRFDGAAACRIIGELVGRRDDFEALARYAVRPSRPSPGRVAAVARGGSARLLWPWAARARGRARLDQCGTIELLAQNVAGERARWARQCLDRAGAGVEPGRGHHHRSGFRGGRLRRPRLGGRGRAPRRVHLSPKLPFGWVDFRRR